LDQDKYGYDSIKGLYDKRWGVEEEIKINSGTSGMSPILN
jgi:hypothetical protein